MIDVTIAEKFINKLTTYTDYNINIMDEKGIIIASRNASRVGTFHEIAFDMLSKKKDVMEVSDQEEFLGVQPGVNLTVTQDGERIGVIGVTGDPAEVKPIALVVKMSIETMLEYEKQKEQMMKRQNIKEQFLNQLLYEKNADRAKLASQAKKLGYTEDYYRIPIVCVTRGEKVQEKMLDKLKHSEKHTNQDISVVTAGNKIVIFKTLPKSEAMFSEYREVVREYLKVFEKEAEAKGIAYRFYIGSIQNQFVNYQSSYAHCSWLERHLSVKGTYNFFYDHVDEYLKDSIPMMEMHKIFGVFSKEFNDSFVNNFLQIIGSLKKSNYNLETSSKELFVHKNTLAFRLDKIRNHLNMNPVKEAKDREFIELLYYYLDKKYGR